MTRLISALALVALVALPALAQDTAHGQKVFTDQKCSICHSIGATGNKKGPLDGVGAKLSAGDIRQWIVAAPEMATKAKAERKPAMKAYATLPKDDVDALVAFLQTLKTK